MCLALVLVTIGSGVSIEQWGALVAIGIFGCGSLVLGALIPSMASLIDRGRRMRSLPANELLRRGGAPVLLLRSFNDDDLIDPTFLPTYHVTHGRYENKFVKALVRLGPAVALGRPGERDPETGASRLYVRDEYWQRAITYLMSRAVAVIAVVGSSPGLWWEIEFAIKHAPLERLLFFFPYPAPQNTRQSYWRSDFLLNPVLGHFVRRKLFPTMDAERRARYAAFRERVNPRLPHPLPESLGDARFIAFSRTGKPRPIDPVKPSFWTRALTLNLNPKLDIPFARELRPFIAQLKRGSS